MFMSTRLNHGKLVNSACHSLGCVRLLPCEVFEKHARSKWQEIADAKRTRSALCHCALSCAFPCSRKPLVAGFHMDLKAPWQMHGRQIHGELQSTKMLLLLKKLQSTGNEANTLRRIRIICLLFWPPSSLCCWLLEPRADGHLTWSSLRFLVLEDKDQYIAKINTWRLGQLSVLVQ